MSSLTWLFLLSGLFSSAMSQTCSPMATTARQTTDPSIASNTYLGLVLPVHRPDYASGAVCGPISDDSITKIEAFFWALRTFERRKQLNGVNTQSGIVFDSCSSADRTYEQLAHATSGQNSVNVLAYLVADTDSVAIRTTKLLGDTTIIGSSLNHPGVPVSSAKNFYQLAATAEQESMAVLELLNRAGWHYVQVVYSNDGYGRQMYEAFTTNSQKNDITVGRSEMLGEDGSTPDLDSNPYVVVVFAYAEQKVKIFKDLGEKNLILVTTNLGGILPEGDGRPYNSRIVELRSELSAMYSVAVDQFRGEVVEKLTHSGTPDTVNPWYGPSWEARWQCDLDGVGDTVFNRPCNSTLVLGEHVDVDPQGVALIIQGVDLMMEALKSTCPGTCGGDTLENRIKAFNGHFHTVGIETTQAFNKDTRGPETWRYKVHLIEREGNTFTDKEVGHVGMNSVTVDGLKSIDRGTVLYIGSSQVVARPVNVDVDYGTRFDAWGYIWVIVIGVLAGLGILLVIVIAILLGILRVKGAMSSYVWLYAVLLFGALLGYLTLFAYIPVPTTATCGITRFGVGISYGICFSVMVVLGLLLCKKSEMFSSTRVSNIFIAVSLILLITIEVVILVSWMIWTPPGVSYALFAGFWAPRRICNHYTLGPGNIFVRTVFENHLLHLIYIMFLILLVLLMAIFIFLRRRNLHASSNKNESYALLAAGIGTGLGTVAIWLVWTLVGALAGARYNDVNNYGDAAMAFGLWFTLTWLLILLLVQIVITWRGSRPKQQKSHHEIKVNLANINHGHELENTKVHNYHAEVTTVDGKVVHENHNNHNNINKIPLIVEPSGNSNMVTSYEQHVETRTENKSHFRPPPVPENEAVHHHEHVFTSGSNYCAECGFQHDPNALRLLHPRSEYAHSSHDNSFDHSTVHHVRGVETDWHSLGPRQATSLQALHLIHPRSRPVSRAGSLDMGNRRLVVHSGNTRVARSEIGTSYGTQGHHYGPNIIDLRRPRSHTERAYYYPSNHNNMNVYFTEKGSSVI